ncbi:MAG: thiolase family protein [Syntrophomonadaceae bacterium]|nr:thiolase family protein [Syntrophomonadaceae bacterium]
MNREAVIVSPVRTPVGKCRGVLAPVPAYKLAAEVIKETVNRTNVNPAEIDDVIYGNLFAFDVANMGRMALLEAGLPIEVPGMTVDRQCSSSLNAIAIAASLVISGFGDLFIAGGVESDSRRPFVFEKPEKGYQTSFPKWCGIQVSPPQVGNPPMGITAENVAELYGISREEQDEFAYLSHTRAIAAQKNGVFDKQIVPITIPQKKGQAVLVSKDEVPRESTNMEALSALKPAFKKDGTVTAGNSSPMSDGASACIVTTRQKAEEMGWPWMLKFKSFAVAAVDPNYMGLGPIYATRKLLSRTGMRLNDFDLIELNEAFAAQSLACIKDLNIDLNRCNVNGGAIALGHPLAGTGGILTAKLAYEMEARGAKNGLVSFCIGGGQGLTAWFESR